ncbi:hypothetical protein JY651_47910 [Pyxidicoccus parkwayensis]|uniref:Lipoprotein n=1 Tax=Pyxidicoccus parkwayensis TaxID=2813578 RepID=A0ABX7NZA6_9BACT|nr:hypothetical protein [Pyxidicoccus parkwaysis]QSQ22744.1 hypothetical protein JY651_47910 [Pyxidicoccus parkwaysis]
MKRMLLSTTTALVLMGTGCAANSGTRASATHVALGDPSDGPLRLDGAAITGPDSSLVIRENGMRGRFRARPMALEWDDQKMTGSVGERATHLELAEGDDTRVWGTFGGLAVDLTEDGTWLQGRVGQCAYALKRERDGFKGMRECGQVLERDIVVSFPQALAARPVGERAALMTLMLVNTKAQPVAPRMRPAPRGGTETSRINHDSY